MSPHSPHLCVSPDGRLAYLSVHKNASTTLNFHFQRRLGWGRAWPANASVRVTDLKDYVPDPDPEQILVVTRRDPDRFFSGVHTIGDPDWDQIDWDDPHVWPLGRFLAPWQHFADRFVFVDMDSINVWLAQHGLPTTNDRLNERKP